MKIEQLDVEAAIDAVKTQLADARDLSPALRAALEVLLVLVTLLLNRLTLNSTNSSQPPSADPNRTKLNKKGTSSRKPGGQPGRTGATLQPVENPDEVTVLPVDRQILPSGTPYWDVGYEARQVIDVKIARVVIEYRAQILEDGHGHQVVAAFPDGVTRPVQYGQTLKAHAVYMSQHQLVPYDRVRDHFQDQLHIPVSPGSLFNFNHEAYERLEDFETWVQTHLARADLLHADETGINIGGTRHWLHVASTASLTVFAPHAKRGTIAMEAMDILPGFTGVLCHDHWKPYCRYDRTHALCNTHHPRDQRSCHGDIGVLLACGVKASKVTVRIPKSSGCSIRSARV